MPNNLYLFANNNEGIAEDLGYYRLYNMKIEGDSEGTKIRDFQPVLDNNGVPCLMDKVNKKYYYDKNGKGFGCDKYSGVSYLKGDGNSWIDTGLIANQMHGYRIETKIINKSVNGENTILFGSSQGGADSADVNCHLRYNYYGYPQGLTFIDDNGTGQGFNLKVNEIYSFVMTVNQPTSSNSFYLCAGNQGDSAIGVCDCGIYYWKVYDTNNNLIQHLIPAIDTDGSIGMYDLVTETFFYNQGTGEFSYGIEESECPKADYVEYLKAPDVGNQIDTGITYDNTYSKIEFKFNTNNCNASDEILRAGGDKNFWFWIYYGNIRFINCDYTFENGSNIDIDVTITSTECIINGTTYTYETPLNSVSQNMQLFSHSNWIKLYYFRVYDSEGNLIQDLHPSLDNDKIPCMYDTVSDSYFYSNGNDTFEHGKSIGYTPIKYIETNGTQYIDTSVIVNDNTYMDIDYRAVAKEYTQVEYLQGDGDNYLNIGNWTFDMNTRVEVQVTTGTGNILCDTLTTEIFYIARIEQGSLRTMWSSNTPFYGGQWFASDINKAIVSTSPTETVITHEGTDYTSTSDITSFSANLNLQVFGQNVYATGVTKVHYLQIYQSEILVFDGIPVLDNEGTPCMYDKISKQFLYNKGTGVFEYGNAVNKNYLMNDFYIESTYKYKEIDTTVEPNLTASDGATLTLGSTYISYLSEEEIEQAIKNGWIIQ